MIELITKGGKFMTQTIVVLKSKTQVMQLVELARGYGFQVKTMPIPKEIKIGCGICVQISLLDAHKILRIVNSYNLNAFYGIFTIEKVGVRSTLKRIY